MDGTQFTKTSFFNDISCPEVTRTESARRPATGFMRPDDVVNDLQLTHAEKREILASWASDVRAVLDAPALRKLDTGGVIHIDDILRALKSLNDGQLSEQSASDPSRSFADLRIRLSRRLGSHSRWDQPDGDDDDDPPPCPAMLANPPGGPPPGEGSAQLSLALTA